MTWRGHRADGNLPGEPARPEEFEAELRRRAEAAKGLEADLLTEVPLLYGSPGQGEVEGDPGIVIARLHREELLRRNGGGMIPARAGRRDNLLPFERTMTALALFFLLLMFFLG